MTSTGCDLVYIPRFEKRIADSGVRERLFTLEELKDERPEHLAGIFAAKEAVLKAIGFEHDAWLELEVTKGSSGKPTISVGTYSDRVTNITISISHDGDYAMAVAVAEIKKI